MLDPKSLVVGGVAVLVLGAGTWSISKINDQTAQIGENVTPVVVSESPSLTPTPEVTTTPTLTPKPTVARLTLSAIAKADGVRLSWQPYAGSDFVYGKVVRSETNSDLRYPDDGYIHYFDKQSLASFVDTTAKSGVSYYYRICAKQKSDAVVCGNVVRVTAITAAATPKETPKTEFTVVTGKLALSTVSSADSVALSWTTWPTDEGFSYYKVVRSASNANPYYPNDGYISVISNRGTLSYTDSDPVSGTSYYRICAVAGQVYCGNVVTVSR